ncbi:MAG: 3-isopropylmalate dehydratase [Burkholderiaceae bacterium]
MTGRVWSLPANVDTDALAPGKAMAGGLEAIAPHCLAAIRPEFASQVRPGDYLVAGANFGIGSSREQAAGVLKHLGIAAVIAPSYAGLFYRNAFNLGLPALICPAAIQIPDHAEISIDRHRSVIVARPDNAQWQIEPVPDFLQALIDAGGLLAQLRQRLAGQPDQTDHKD